MDSIINEISRLRKGSPLIIDYKDSNKYRVVALEANGTKTAYYFTTPVYSSETGKMLDMKFRYKNGIVCSEGSNSSISVSDCIRIKNIEGSCTVFLSGSVRPVSENEFLFGNDRVFPTTNGIAIRSNCTEEAPFVFTIETNRVLSGIRANDKYFALMSERFRPFLVFSCIGTSDANRNIISPAKISYEKITDEKYTVTVTPCSSLGKSVLVEVNLYEPKLFLDTTVESKNRRTNNAFGGVAFVGNTDEFGEQWLYSKVDYTKISEVNEKSILSAVLHIPKLNNAPIVLSAYKTATRFCSFGSTWVNKIAESTAISDSRTADRYIELNLTSLFTDKEKKLLKSDGFILKPKNKNVGFSAISTADNYLFPQILEINYKK